MNWETPDSSGRLENARLRADQAQHQLAAAATSRAAAESESGRLAAQVGAASRVDSTEQMSWLPDARNWRR